MLGMWLSLTEFGLSLGRASALRATVVTGPELNAHRRQEPSEFHRRDARPWVIKGEEEGHNTHNSICFGHLSSFHNALTLKGSTTVKAAMHSFLASCSRSDDTDEFLRTHRVSLSSELRCRLAVQDGCELSKGRGALKMDYP